MRTIRRTTYLSDAEWVRLSELAEQGGVPLRAEPEREDPKDSIVHFRLSSKDRQRLDELAAAAGTNMTAVLRDLIRRA